MSHADPPFSYRLACRRCGWQTICGPDDAAARLRLVGLLRREADPDEAILGELLIDAAPRMTCPLCKEKSLAATPATAEELEEAGDWQAAVLCEVCREPILLERLEAVPGVLRCARCQGQAERKVLVDEELEFCPHCGAVVEVRVNRGGGITRYKRVCTGFPPCRL